MARPVYVKNVTASGVQIDDLSGIYIEAYSQRDLREFFSLDDIDYSLDLRTVISAGLVVLNDGENDLSMEESLDISSMPTFYDLPDKFISLQDTPDVYEDDKYLKSTTSGVEWATVSGGSGISNHSELNELDYVTSGHYGFSPTIHTHIEADITDLDKYTQTEVDTISGSLQTNIDVKPDSFLELDDTLTTYSGHGTKYARVSKDESYLDFDYMEWDQEGSPLIPETAISGTYLVNFEGGRLLIGATGNKPDLVYLGPIAGLAFDASKIESCYGSFKIPYAWNYDTDIEVTVNFMVDDAQVGTKVCSWRLGYHSYKHGEVYSDKVTTVVEIDFTLPNNAAAGTFITHTLIIPCDCVNNPLDRGNVITFQFYREGSYGNDTMVGDSILIALMFELYTGKHVVGG